MTKLPNNKLGKLVFGEPRIPAYEPVVMNANLCLDSRRGALRAESHVDRLSFLVGISGERLEREKLMHLLLLLGLSYHI